MSKYITIDPNATVAAESFRVMPNLRWIERDEAVEVDLEGNIMSSRRVKVLQQLQLGNMGTEKWEGVPTITELNQNKEDE